jgi:CubicO group peptidase (beta-lactamase class C family)
MTRTHPTRLAGILATAALLYGCAPAARAPGVRADFGARLDSIVPALLREHAIPGFAVGVVENGRVTFTRGYGVADRAAGRPMTAQTLLNFASVSKPVTAWGVLRLADDGSLPLDAPVGPLLRRWRLPPSELGTDGVTVRRLLSHTAGTSVPSAPFFPADTALPGLEQVLRGEAGDRGAVAVQYAPGARWAYSGGGYAILELLVEEASGQSFDAYMRGTVLQPLGLRRTTFAPAAVSGDGVATPYDEAGNPIAPYRLVGTAAGGLYSSVDEFARFLTAYTGSRRRILRPATFDAMLTALATVELEGVETGGARYGLGHGVHLTRAGERLVYHSGGNPGYRAYFLVMPERGHGMVLASNGDGSAPALIRLLQLWSEHYGVDLPTLF